MTKKFLSIAAILTVALALTISASAQTKRGGINARLFELVKAAKQGRAKLNPEIAKQVRDDFDEKRVEIVDFGPSIVGTWNILVPESDGGFPPFEALHTFGSDGTFVETSSNLGVGAEGPAHGAYERSTRGYILAFELFIFDPETGASVGRVRVRCSIRMLSSNQLTAATAVDLIEPDGTVIPDIDGGPFTGTRLRARGV
jgi:hypothetical protein